MNRIGEQDTDANNGGRIRVERWPRRAEPRKKNMSERPA